jgi:plastocyanin
LNNITSPNLTLNVGDQLEFILAVNVSIHPLTICQNSPAPSFCQGVGNSSQLGTSITLAGTNISVTFTTAGTYYYGCHTHPGMGATINVTQTGGTGGDGQKLSASFLFIAVIPLLSIIFI